ncbi:TnsA endonuclease N-terminal domain-containing protein [Salibacterium sp. K-3]
MALNREKTLQISETKQIKHPLDTTSQTPIVLTTDFLITLIKGKNISYLPRTIKPSKKLNDNRIIEKFEIEREYWFLHKQVSSVSLGHSVFTPMTFSSKMCSGSTPSFAL